MYRLEQFDLIDYDNWDSSPENIEFYNVIYNNEPILEKNVSLAILVNKETPCITPVIKVLEFTFAYSSSSNSISSRFGSVVNCYIYDINEVIDNFKDIACSDEFISFLKELYELLLE